MTLQEILAYALGAVAVVYLVVRYARRRAVGNCCGEKECPAAKQLVDRINRGPSPPASIEPVGSSEMRHRR